MEGLSVSAVEKSRLLDSRYAFRTLRISDDERGNTGRASGCDPERKDQEVGSVFPEPYAGRCFLRVRESVGAAGRIFGHCVFGDTLA